MTQNPKTSRRLGYARVSTVGQTLDAQLEQLKADGCTRIYREKASGARPDRRQLLRLLAGTQVGDVVTVTRIDRLARSTFDLFAIVKRIVERRRPVPISGGAMGGHRDQHRPTDDCRPWWLG
jgi:DNA invertase Pin-like site-specific DNA recombinase